MKIIVKAKPNAKKEAVERLNQPTLGFPGNAPEPDMYAVSVKEPPVDGRANEAIVRVLAKHFGVSRSEVVLVSGHMAKRKVFEIKA